MKINIQKLSKYISLITVVVLIFSIISVPSYAADTTGFENQPIPYITDSQSSEYGVNNGFVLFTNSYGNITCASRYDVNTYVCYVTDSGKYLFGCDNDASNQAGATIYYKNSSSSYNRYEVSMSAVDETTNIRYGHSSTEPTSIYVPTFANTTEACAAIKQHINSSAGTVAEFNYSIKPGYALFIDIHGLSDVSGTLFTNTSAAYASPHTSNQTLSYQSALPSGNVSPQGNGINWQGTGNKDLFGRYKSWNRSLIIQPNSHYIAIYNPVHINSYVDPEHEDFNGNISVHVNKAYSETSILIPLNTELTGTGTVGSNTTEDRKPVVFDENTNTWIPQNSDGTPYPESPYGDYMPSTVNSIHDWLKNIANLISGFFNGAIGAVTTLVGAGSAFINSLVSLYSWLPGSVYAVLSSALILVITIGVIKVFI